jgi:gamma-glutamylcyclotransferase (GGCT)/AIG2-like uncharacterized protein YtfP
MEERCQDFKILEVGRLEGYRLSFTHYSPTWKSGVSDVVADCNSEVWGLVYELSENDLKNLDSYESYPNVYTRFKTFIKAKSRIIPDVWVYTVVKKKDFISPNKDYLELIKSAAVKFGFPDIYRSYLETIKTADTSNSNNRI